MAFVDIDSRHETVTVFPSSGVAAGTRAWELGQSLGKVDCIHANHVLERLTTMEADAALIDWFDCLEIGGLIHISAIDADYYMRLWLEADWTENTLTNPQSDARMAFSGLFGNQQHCNPRWQDYDGLYRDVNKSAYNERRLGFLMKRVGFVDVDVQADGKGGLTGRARKSMNRGERQIATDLASIRPDHLNRYNFAAKVLEPEKPGRILDLACGIGYGTCLLANRLSAESHGVDVDAGAIEHAEAYFSNGRTHYHLRDARELAFPTEHFDAIVSFETIEHVDFDQSLLETFFALLKAGGLFVCSTPNEDVMPFSKDAFPYHVRHYRVKELEQQLEDAGFRDIQFYTQSDRKPGEVRSGTDGCYTIAVARR